MANPTQFFKIFMEHQIGSLPEAKYKAVDQALQKYSEDQVKKVSKAVHGMYIAAKVFAELGVEHYERQRV